MNRVEIVIVGSRRITHRTGCCGRRSQEDIILGYIPNLYRRFGQRRFGCRYLDIDDKGALAFPGLVKAVKEKSMGLPLALRDGEVILHGQSTLFRIPDYVQDQIERLSANPSLLQTPGGG